MDRPDHTGMTAMDNLGSHLLAIRAYAVPQSALQEIRSGYEQLDERCVWVERGNARTASINLLANKERIIQKFIAKVEASLEGAEFPLDLEFASGVANDSKALG